MHHLVTHTGTQQGHLKRARSQSATQQFPFRGILARGRGLWQEGGVLVKAISDLLGRLPEGCQERGNDGCQRREGGLVG